ncbi:metallophosphoesterase [Pseudomonadales bacterium]|nr:metallophosphoesterase [Pseudomonadales bacterium]
MKPIQTTWLKITGLLLTLGILVAITAISIIDNTIPRMQSKTLRLLTLANPDAADPLRIAFLSDLHFNGHLESAVRLEQLLTRVIAAQPDVILLGGDYTTSVTNEADLRALRGVFAEIFSKTKGIPVVAVLGNHEAWTALPRWRASLQSAGIAVLENEVLVLAALGLCVRGLGDYYSGGYQFTDFPAECDNHTALTLTHDPAAAFQPGIEGLVLAGHTHCGQVSLPFIGAPWAPSSAPRKAHCGLYSDEIRQVLVTPGIGTSVLPVRLGTQAQWELVTLYR